MIKNTIKSKSSLKTKLIRVMVLLICLQSLSLVMVIDISNMFGKLDDASFFELEKQVEDRRDSLHSDALRISNNTITNAMSINKIFWETSQTNNVPMNEIYADDSSYEEVALKSARIMAGMLDHNEVTGAFFILNGSNDDKSNEKAHSTVYITNLTPDMVATRTNEYRLEIGPKVISKAMNMTISDNWTLDIKFDKYINEESHDFYYKTIESYEESDFELLETHGYWSMPQSTIIDENKQTIYYTLPLIDENNESFGIIGVEIAIDYFAKYYLPNNELAYNDSFYTITVNNENIIDSKHSALNGELTEYYLTNEEILLIEPMDEHGFNTVEINGLNKVYCKILPLNLYNEESIYAEDNLVLIAFVPEEELHKTTNSVRSIFYISLGGITLFCFGAIFFIAHILTRKITKLSSYVRKLSPYQQLEFQKTELSEIDELTNAIMVMNKRAIESAKTIEYILKITDLDLGGYEILQENKGVIFTEYIGRILGLEKSIMENSEWKNYFAEFTKNPSEEKENIYRYSLNNKNIWLKIIETDENERRLGIVFDVTKEMDETLEMQRALDYDQLTNLYNREAYKRKVNDVINSQPDKIGAMIFMDLDNLKYMNDTFGHEMGDKLITSAGNLFNNFTKYNGKVARISGDEFSIYIHGFDTKDEIRNLIKEESKIFDKFKLSIPDGTEQKIRYSAGIAWYPDDSNNSVELLKLSDFAMYQAKHNEKGATYEFSKEIYEKKKYLLENSEAINELLEEEKITFVYQPIVDIKTGEVYAYEALMRSELEEFKTPMEILEVATAESKLGKLEKLVLTMAIADAYNRKEDFNNRLIFINSINILTILKEDYEDLKGIYGEFLEQIVIEIGETKNITAEQIKEGMELIREYGMKCAIDNYGKGYYNDVVAINPDIIKMDLKLVKSIQNNEDKQKIVENLLEFTNKNNISVVAQGIENEMDLEKILPLEIDFIQGFYLGKPSRDIEDIPVEIKNQIKGE